jgi:hypothetical protein
MRVVRIIDRHIASATHPAERSRWERFKEHIEQSADEIGPQMIAQLAVELVKAAGGFI